MKRPSGFVLYEGPSVLDGQPIVCVATMRTANPKTGPSVAIDAHGNLARRYSDKFAGARILVREVA